MTLLLRLLTAAFGTKLPFAALQHYVGYWGQRGLNADGTLGPLMTQADYAFFALKPKQ